MTVEANKALVLQYINIKDNFALLDEIIAPDFVDHSHPEFRPGPFDIKQNLIDFYTAFPDAFVTIDDIIGEGDIVAFRFTLQGTHTGNLCRYFTNEQTYCMDRHGFCAYRLWENSRNMEQSRHA